MSEQLNLNTGHPYSLSFFLFVTHHRNTYSANSTGDALIIDKCNYPGGNPTVSITGGTFTSANAQAVGSYVGNNATEPVTGFVKGGTFSDNSAKTYADASVAVASIGGTYYVGNTAINNAVNGMGVGDTITVEQGTVTVNGNTVTAGTSYTVPARYYYNSTTTDTKTTDTKGSPKTFDAGIALYVGMALTSAAGVAFVGKKRED